MLVVAGPAVAPDAAADPEERTLSLYNIHTKETITITYKRDGRYIPSAMSELNRFLRDWRRDAETRMDPELIDLVWELGQELGVSEPIHVISGYRSQETNSALRSQGRNVARRSQHIEGKAMDVYFPGVPVENLRNAALVREAGGVGYYPRSGTHGFVHVDTARVRHWPRISQQQMARIFREHRERSQHQPREERTPVYLADNANGQDRELTQSRRPPADVDYPLPLDKPVMVARNETVPEATPERGDDENTAADQTTQLAAAPRVPAEPAAPVQQASNLGPSQPPAALSEGARFIPVAAPVSTQETEPNRNLMFFPLAILRHDEEAAMPAAQHAAYRPAQQQPAEFQQVVNMRGTLSDMPAPEEEALVVANLIQDAGPPRQLSSSELSRLARQVVDRDGKGPLLMSQHRQPVPVSNDKDGKLDAPETIIDLINGTDGEVAEAPADLTEPTVRLGLGETISAPGDVAGEQPLSMGVLQ